MHRIQVSVVVCLVMLAGVSSQAGANAPFDWSIVLEVASFQLGEPIAIGFTLTVGEEPLITEASALDPSLLWLTLLVSQVLPDGQLEDLAPDTPLPTPTPIARWIERNGEMIPVEEAVVLERGSVVNFELENLLRNYPLLAPGDYVILSLLVLPVHETTCQDERYGEALLVTLDDFSQAVVSSEEIQIQITPPEGASDEDLEQLEAARTMYAREQKVASAIEGFEALLSGTESDHIRACCQYWIGEVYERFAQIGDAISAYEAVVRSHADSVFEKHAVQRLAQLTSPED